MTHPDVYQGECGSRWEQIGPANFRIKWRGDPETAARVAFRRFGSQLEHAVGARVVTTGEYVEVAIQFRDTPSWMNSDA